MSESIANKLDLAVIHGSGSSGQPTGMLNATESIQRLIVRLLHADLQMRYLL